METTGLNPKNDQILMVAAVVEDTEILNVPVKDLPYFCCYVYHNEYHGDAYALSMNAWILRILSGRSNEDEPEHPIYNGDKDFYFTEWSSEFENFLQIYFPKKRGIVLAGKNVASFDYQFLPKDLRKYFAHRFIDPGSVFIDWSKDKPLDLITLKKELDIEGPVTHDALEDARDVISILRKSY